MARSAHQFVLQVAVPSPLWRCFDYLPPAEAPLPQVGCRVKVSFGRQQLIGIVTALNSDTSLDRSKLKSVEAILDAEPLLTPELLALYRWASTYYLFPIGMALQTSLPKALREGKTATISRPLRWRLNAAASVQEESLRSSTQKDILSLLRTYQSLSTPELSSLLNKSAKSGLLALEQKGLIEQVSTEAVANPAAALSESPLSLDSQQAAALAAIKPTESAFRCHLLEGVTGSGKTEVYLHLIQQVLATGKQVLMLVPEINLTPQTIERFSKRFHATIVAFHSGLTDKQRLQGWLQAREGSAHIVIGTRSAIFTPLARAGLIIIDEEHDDSYKQQDGFRYNARDVAIYRAHELAIPIVLGTATPSLESLHNAQSGRYQLLQLPERAGAASMPAIKVLDLKLQRTTSGISELLQQEITRTLAANQQVLIFLNRRGFAPTLQCQECGWVAECSRCDRSYTLHQQPRALRCHHCDGQRQVPQRCPACESHALEAMGLGTERSAAYLASQFPDYPVLRIDRDSTRAQGDLDKLLQTIHSGIPCILIGTQMLAKGHHFPRVTLVAILDADSGLFSADFRAQENLGQLLTQVAGRAGRSDLPGQVLIQTFYPQHPALQQLVSEGYGPFARALLKERAQGHLPPFVHFLLIRTEANNQQLPIELLHLLLQEMQQHCGREVIFFGPMPSPFGKKAGLFRAQLIVQAPKRSSLQKLGPTLTTWIEATPDARKARWLLDVDPIDFS